MMEMNCKRISLLSLFFLNYKLYKYIISYINHLLSLQIRTFMPNSALSGYLNFYNHFLRKPFSASDHQCALKGHPSVEKGRKFLSFHQKLNNNLKQNENYRSSFWLYIRSGKQAFNSQASVAPQLNLVQSFKTSGHLRIEK